MFRSLWPYRYLGLAVVAALFVAMAAVATLGGGRSAHAGGPADTLQCTDRPKEGYTCISLDPKTGSNTVGDTHTVTATVTTDFPAAGTPVEGLDLYIFVIKGPNAGERIHDVTDAEGKVDLTYTGDGGVGTDQMGTEACFNDCTFGVDAFIDGCVADPDPCVDTFFNDPTCNGSEGDPFICDNATKDWAAPPTPEPTPTPTSAPTPAPSPSPAAAPAGQLPDTGGRPSDGDSSALPWLAAMAGAVALMGAGGGLWLAYQKRRVR